MGALTSKPYAFKVRPWELQHTYTEDIFEFFFTPLRLDYRKNFLLRVLPNPDFFFRWISDIIRFNLPVLVSKASDYVHFGVCIKAKVFNIYSRTPFLNFLLQTFLTWRFYIYVYTDKTSNIFSQSPYNFLTTNTKFFSSQIFKLKKFFVFFQFNLRAFSPVLLSMIRKSAGSTAFCFFGPYFDLFNTSSSSVQVYSFSVDEFFKIFITRTSHYAITITLQNSLIFRPLDPEFSFPASDFYAVSTFANSTFFNFEFLNPIKHAQNLKNFFGTLSHNFQLSSYSKVRVFAGYLPVTFEANIFDVVFFTPTFSPYKYNNKQRSSSFFATFFFSQSYVDDNLISFPLFPFLLSERYFSHKDFNFNRFFLTTQYSKLYLHRFQKLQTSFPIFKS